MTVNRERLLQIARARPEAGVLPLLLAATLLFPKRAPLGIYGLGLASAALLVLPSVGVILVHRSNRIVNFAQVVVANTTATFFTFLVIGSRSGGRWIGYFPLLRALEKVCSPCVTTTPVSSQAAGLYVVGPAGYALLYALGIVAAIVFAVIVSAACYAVVSRFEDAPRLLVTVATIFLAQTVAAGRIQLPQYLTTPLQRERALVTGAVPPPFDWSFPIGRVRIDTASVVSVIAAFVAVSAVIVYFRISAGGAVIRAAADNRQRVGTLGVDARAMTFRVWLVAGGLAGVAGVLLGMTVGSPLEQGSSLAIILLVRILAVAALARMTSIVMAVAASIVLGMFEQATQWGFGSTQILDALLLMIIAVTLLVQRGRASRAEVEQASGWKADREIRPIPRELRDLPSVRAWRRGLAAAGVGVVLGLPWVLSSGQAYIGATTFVFGIVGLSLLVLTGWTGQISLGQMAFAAVGAYVAARSGVPFLLMLPVGMLAGAASATVVGIPALRLRGLQLASVTLAVSVTATTFLLNPKYLGARLPRTLSRPSVAGISFRNQRWFYYLCLVALVLVCWSVLGMRRSRTARVLIAARDNEQAAQSFGISVVRARVNAFALSGALAGLAGALYAVGQQSVRAEAFPPEMSVTLFLATVIGGFGSLSGPLLGAGYFGLLSIVGASETVVFLSGGVGGLVLLLTIGGGLNQAVFRIRDNLLRRDAYRNDIAVPSLLADARLEGRALRQAPILPNTDGGAPAFVPRRYRIDEQPPPSTDGPDVTRMTTDA